MFNVQCSSLQPPSLSKPFQASPSLSKLPKLQGLLIAPSFQTSTLEQWMQRGLGFVLRAFQSLSRQSSSLSKSLEVALAGLQASLALCNPPTHLAVERARPKLMKSPLINVEATKFQYPQSLQGYPSPSKHFEPFPSV